MSPLTRLMSTAILGLYQPPFFIRTTWLFAELEDLAEPGEAQIFAAIKVARHRQNLAGIGKLLELVDANSAVLIDGRKRHERGQLCKWIREQIEREGV